MLATRLLCGALVVCKGTIEVHSNAYAVKEQASRRQYSDVKANDPVGLTEEWSQQGLGKARILSLD